LTSLFSASAAPDDDDVLPCEASADPEEAASLISDAMGLLADVLVAPTVFIAEPPF